MKEHYTVGEFSELFGLNVQTLRYYDSIKLFQPAHRDKRTSRRQYSFDQVYGLASIRFLRQLDYSLDEVQDYLNQREATDTLATLEKRSEELHRQLEEMRRLDVAIRRKITYTQAALQEVAEQGGASSLGIRTYGPRSYLPIGDEDLLYHDDSFYLYPTVVFYEGELKLFGAYLYNDGQAPGKAGGGAEKAPKVIAAGEYLCGYHTGPYERVPETEDRMRNAYPQLILGSETIDFNIIDQFVERDSEKYLTAMQIKIEGRL